MVSILGSGLVYAGKSTATRYAGLLLMGVYSCSMPISLAMISSNVGGFTKKTTVSAIYFIMYCAGNIIGPQLFFTREAPKYQVSLLSSQAKPFVGYINTDVDLERFPGHNYLPRHLCYQWLYVDVLPAVREFSS